MTSRFTAEEFERLGLSRCALVASVTIPWPIEEVSEGLSREELVAGALSVWIAATAFLPARVPELASSGIRIELGLNKPGLVRLVAAAGGALVPEGDVESASDPRVPGSVCVQTHGDDVVVFRLADGRVLLVSRGDGGLEIDYLKAEEHSTAEALSVEPLAEIAAPVWLAEEADQWLRQTAERLSARGSSWHNSVAVGLLARLRELDPDQPAAVQLQQVMRGNGPGTFSKARAWARELTANARETLSDLGMAEIDALYALTEDLSEDYNPDSPRWGETLLALCHRRDDVECVRLLLSISGGSTPLEVCLDGLDESARELMFALPERPIIRDERLRRVARLDDSAWWAQPAIA